MTRGTSRRWVMVVIALTYCVAVAPVGGQAVTAPNRGGITPSMGIPPLSKWSLGASTGVHRDVSNEATAYVVGSVYRDLLSPSLSALGLNMDLYGGRRGSFDTWTEGWDWGIRAGLFSPVLRLGFGADYNGDDDELDFFVSLLHPLKRGGIFVGGGALRIDYLPGRNHTTSIGVSLPVGQRFAGRTRPPQDRVRLRRVAPLQITYAPEASMLGAAGNVRETALWINRLTVPFVDQWDGDWDESMELFTQEMLALRDYLNSDPSPMYAGRRTPVDEVRAYHREMERLFSIASSGREPPLGSSTPSGRAVWDRAREILLDAVVLPYNRLLGQKKVNDSALGLGTAAAGEFYEWLSVEGGVADDRLMATAWAFQEALNVLESVLRSQDDAWPDSRFHFLPYQLVLRPEEHDTQAELDTILERAVEERFREGNRVYYVENEQFQVEFARMVREARDYSVLWIHDYKGVNASGAPDQVAFLQTVDVYLRALVDAVRAYDDSGKIPQHIIILDQWYFQANDGELFLRLLQDPLHHRLRLPRGYEEWERQAEAVQEELRAAVAGSRLMQAQAEQYVDGWIENVVKVHVNITNPADVSFWSGELIPFVGLPDLVARDHRKIAFFDIGEEDPYRGRAVYTGMGIGEHYVGAGWEDRALLVQGPAVLSLKEAARDLLLQQGFGEDEIPYELRPRPLAGDYEQRIEQSVGSGETLARAMQVHNRVTHAQKDVDVLKATLYTLLPPGSVIKAPDSIWNLPLWGSMMLGAALRGGRSLVIAPSLDHAPSSGFPQMSRSQELLGRLVIAQAVLEDYLSDVGGMIRVGLYAPEADVGNTPTRLRQAAATLEDTDWLMNLYDLEPGIPDSMRIFADELDATGFSRAYQIEQEPAPPALHLKAHLFATAEAWNGLMDGPEMWPFLSAYYRAQAEQNRALAEGRPGEMDAMTRAIIPPGRELISAHVAELSPEDRERAALYFTLGSHNQNFHSFIWAGEVAFAVSGWDALHGLPDFLTLAGLSVWVDDLDEFEALFPRFEGIRRRLSRWMRISV